MQNNKSKIITSFAELHRKQSQDNIADDKRIEDSLEYPASEDIFNNANEIDMDINDSININPNHTQQFKVNKIETHNEMLGNDLDVPGAELDDANEDIGEEDEENNYYSLGGDEHNDLDEN